MNEAAKKLYISQPSLSGAIKELEIELGFDIFLRSNRGIVITPEGKEFLSYAAQMIEQYDMMYERFVEKSVKTKFGVSMQHYTFAIKAFVEVVKQFGMEEFEFAVRESTTHDIINNVKEFKSELGVIYESDFNEKAIEKLLAENNLEFTELFECDTFVYLWSGHPLANNDSISITELEEYPCLAFDQGDASSFYLAEEILSTYDYKRIIRANDRATMLNLMVGLNGYTLCSGIICEDMNGDAYKAVPLKESEKMRIGYIKRKGSKVSKLGELYIEELKKYEANVLR